MSNPTIIPTDCLEALKRMDEETFDLILSDPPYMEYKTSFRLDRKDKLSQPILYQSQEDQLETIGECIRVLKTGKAFFLFTNWENSWWVMERFHTFIRNQIIWVKNNWSGGDLKGSFGCQYEVILLGTKGSGWTYKGKRESDVWMIDMVTSISRIHPTEKPVELYKKIIINSTNEGDLILDPYGGSGSSAIAALELNRNIVVYELDPEYHSRIERRIREWKLQR